MRSALMPGLGLLIALAAFAEEKPKLTARELFYTPIADVKTTPVKETAQKTPPPKVIKPKVNTQGKTPDGTKMETASTGMTDVVGPPLALKYRLLKRTDTGEYDEVDTDTVFRSGDKIKVAVEPNDTGYLYIVQQGTSKTWNLLFPNEDTEQGSNRVDRNQEVDLPAGGRFTFDAQKGEEKLFLVLTRRPEPDLEKLIYSLSQAGTGAQPASTPKTEEKHRMMLAQNRIEGSVIDRLRGQVLARDLVFEKVNDDVRPSKSAGTRREKAMYVASPDRTVKARVIVDLTLKHE